MCCCSGSTFEPEGKKRRATDEAARQREWIRSFPVAGGPNPTATGSIPVSGDPCSCWPRAQFMMARHPDITAIAIGPMPLHPHVGWGGRDAYHFLSWRRRSFGYD